MRILITGGAGFLGTHLIHECLKKQDSEITVLDSLEFSSTRLPENLKSVWDRITYIRGSVCNEKILKELIPYQHVIFHCAAQTSHIISIQDPQRDAEVNAEGTLKLLETMRSFNREAVLIYPSTTSVIGKTLMPIIDEKHPLNPVDIYSIHKALSERYCLSYAKFHGIKVSVLRFGNLYGAYGKADPEYGFINYFIHQARNHRPLPIFGKGEQIRNVTYAEDAANLMLRSAFQSALYGNVWFATSPHHLSISQIAQEITRMFQSGSIEFQGWPEQRLQIDIGSVRFSSAALERHMGPAGPTDFAGGLQKVIHHFNLSAKSISV